MGSSGLLSLDVWLALVAFGAGAAGWFAYFHWRNQAPHHVARLRAVALVGGVGSVFAALGGYQLMARVGLCPDWTDLTGESWSRAVKFSLIIGLVEEGAKLSIALPLLRWRSQHRSRSHAPRDWLVVAVCVGLGFAVAESAALYLRGELSATAGLSRAVAAPLIHALFAAPWGWGLGAVLVLRRLSPLAAGLSASVMTHGLYDLLLARPELPNVVAAVPICVLWVWFVRRAPVGLQGERGPAASPMRATVPVAP